jgi:hypothetical protein
LKSSPRANRLRISNEKSEHGNAWFNGSVYNGRAGDIIAAAVAAMAFGATSEAIARTGHAHPTLAEALKEAALAVHGCSIHS